MYIWREITVTDILKKLCENLPLRNHAIIQIPFKSINGITLEVNGNACIEYQKIINKSLVKIMGQIFQSCWPEGSHKFLNITHYGQEF